MCLALAATSVAAAGSHLSGGRKGGSVEQQNEDGDDRRQEIRASGLTAVFPRDAECPEISSPYASTTRYDGSRRNLDRFGGMHGGIDISLPEGTPLLAIAAGKVIHAGTGGMLTGHFLWLQHAPDDRGLSFWVYSKYQHFREVSDLPVGTAVKAGQRIATSGRSGTAGRHYGRNGYPHLHLTTYVGGGEKFETRDTSVIVAGSKIADPLSIYARGDVKQVEIPYVTADGLIVPVGSRVAWPVACKRR